MPLLGNSSACSFIHPLYKQSQGTSSVLKLCKFPLSSLGALGGGRKIMAICKWWLSKTKREEAAKYQTDSKPTLQILLGLCLVRTQSRQGEGCP